MQSQHCVRGNHGNRFLTVYLATDLNLSLNTPDHSDGRDTGDEEWGVGGQKRRGREIEKREREKGDEEGGKGGTEGEGKGG